REVSVPARRLARKELQHQAIDLWRVLVRRPVAGAGNPVQVERADGGANLADQELGGPERRVVALAPEQPHPAGERGEVAQQRSPTAHLAAVEAGAADVLDLDVHGLLAHARGIAQHVDEQVVAADLAESRLVVARLLVDLSRPVDEAPRGVAAGRRATSECSPARY